MSAPDTRLVPMTEAQRQSLLAISDRFGYLAALEEVVAAWDAAPADPAEVVAEVLTRLYGSVTLTWGNERDVLAALGCVSARETNEKPA